MFEDMIKSMMKLKSSTNYHFCNNYLPSLLFSMPEAFLTVFQDESFIKVVFRVLCQAMSEDGFNMDDYRDLKYWIKRDPEHKLAGVILEIPNPEIEPECNYVCVLFTPKGPIYYESELYEEGYFGLCSRDANGCHFNYGRTVDDIREQEQMWLAVITKETNAR